MSGHSTEENGTVVLETRRWRKPEEREAIVSESQELGANVSAVARRHGIAPSLLFRWRREAERKRARAAAKPDGFLPVRFAATRDGGAPDAGHGTVEIVLGHGVRLIVNERSDLALVKRVIAALA